VSTAILAVGAKVAYDGEVWSVVDLAGSRATIEAAGGRSRSVAITRLLCAPNHLLVDDTPAVPGVGQVFSSLNQTERAQLSGRLAHVRELLTSYRSGDAADALPGEPRPSYDPDRPRMERYAAKADELGVGLSTLRRWVAAYKDQDVAGLLDLRHHRSADPLRRVDQRWLDMLASVLAEHTGASRPPRHLLLERVAARVEALHGPGVVPIPKEWKGRAALAATTKGTNALSGATKAKRSIAGRPPTPYGRLQATRPGEYLVLDTNSLDVFAMEPLTLRWVSVQLSVAMDLCSRSIVALRLAPVSTKAVDAAVLLYEAISPDSKARTSGGILAYPGVPSVVLVDPDKATDRPGLPAVVPETLVVDHGKIYLSEHVRTVCARFGISIQPARPYRATDKGALERFFRTLREDLLAALPGYKGPDVFSRGEHPEADAYYFIDELEQILREWASERYHRLPHEGLVEPAVPGLALSPAEMFEAGVARAGRLRVPARADLAYDFCPSSGAPSSTTASSCGACATTARESLPTGTAAAPTRVPTWACGRCATTPTTSPGCSSRTPTTIAGMPCAGRTPPRCPCPSAPRPWPTPADWPARPRDSPTTAGPWPSSSSDGTPASREIPPSAVWPCACPSSGRLALRQSRPNRPRSRRWPPSGPCLARSARPTGRRRARREPRAATTMTRTNWWRSRTTRP